MLANLRFRMVNSIGTTVAVNLYNEDDLLEYEILFPELGAESSQRKRLSRSKSEKLLQKLKKQGLEELLFGFNGLDRVEQGDFWSIHLELDDGREIEFSGPEPSRSVFCPIVQDLAELLDQQFQITHYIRDDRIDRLEIDFLFNELDPSLRDVIPYYDQCDHSENIVLDRNSRTLSYRKRFPSSYFHSSYECRCDSQVRQILDQSTELFVKGRLFENLIDGPRVPVLFFHFTFHDGQEAHVQRSLSRKGLRDEVFMELLEVISETLITLMFKQGLFDRRFLFSKGCEGLPFSISYSESEGQQEAELAGP